MGDLLNFTSDNDTIVELLENGVHFSPVLLRNFNIQKGDKFPVVLESEKPTVFKLAWGIDPMVKLPQSKNGYPMKLTHIYTPSVFKQSGLKKLAVANRLVIPVNKFIHQSKNGVDIRIKHSNGKILFMAGLWSELENGQYGFAILTTDVKNKKAYPFGRIPVFLDSETSLSRWLNPETKIFTFLESYTNDTVPFEIEVQGNLINQ